MDNPRLAVWALTEAQEKLSLIEHITAEARVHELAEQAKQNITLAWAAADLPGYTDRDHAMRTAGWPQTPGWEWAR